MKRVIILAALAVAFTFSTGTFLHAAEPAPQPAPTDGGKDKKNPSGPKLFEDKKDEEKKDTKGGK